MRGTFFRLFILHLVTRALFASIIGFYHNYELQADSIWLVKMADQVLVGNLNFDIIRFIASPLFPIVCAF
ncbi:MAG: hypothetical protein V4615_16360, partial [Bacteroidota bacterium]